MKNIIIPLIAAMAMLGMAGCEKDPIENANSSAEAMHRFLIGTKWRYAAYVDTFDKDYNILLERPDNRPCALYDRLEFDDDSSLSISNAHMNCTWPMAYDFLNTPLKGSGRNAATGYGSSRYKIRQYMTYEPNDPVELMLECLDVPHSYNILYRYDEIYLKNDSTLFLISQKKVGVSVGGGGYTSSPFGDGRRWAKYGHKFIKVNQ